MCVWSTYFCLLSAITIVLLKYPSVGNWLYMQSENRLFPSSPTEKRTVTNVSCAGCQLIDDSTRLDNPPVNGGGCVDLFLVSHGHQYDKLHRVCLVDFDGRLVSSYGSTRGREPGHLFTPVRLAVGRWPPLSGGRGRGQLVVHVADVNNDRVLTLGCGGSGSGQLRHVHEMRGFGDRGPRRVVYDDENGLLYVGVNKWSLEKDDTSGHVEIHRFSGL